MSIPVNGNGKINNEKIIFHTLLQRKRQLNRRKLASRHFLEFVKYTMPEYQIAWFHRILCGILEDWYLGKILRLMIFTPPRHGKSQLVSRHLPAFIFGKNPDANIISASFNMDLAGDMNNDVQKIIDSQLYRNVFPNTTLTGMYQKQTDAGTRYKRTDKQFHIVGHKGKYQSAGVETGITGRGFTHGIIDDPVKNRTEAESITKRNTVWNWYKSTFDSRQEGEVPILLTVTRWNEDDLAGRLLEAVKKGGKYALPWKVVYFPALAEPDEVLHPLDIRKGEGEALWPEKFSRRMLLSKKANDVDCGEYDWNSLYQQHPLPAGGAKIKRHWFKIKDNAPENLTWCRFWDLAVSAKKSADFTASIMGAVDSEGNIYLKDMIHGQWEWPDVKRNIISASLSEDISIGIELGGQQKGFLDELIEESDLMSVSVTGHSPDKDKLTRALPWIARAEAGKIYLINGSWVNEFLNECQSFTGVGDKHDDQIDAVSGAYGMISGPPAADVGIDSSPGDYQADRTSFWDDSSYQIN